MEYEDNPVSIKYYVKKYLLKNRKRFEGKNIVDFPAGNGITSRIIKETGGNPLPFDLFPEYFKVDGLRCGRANIADGIPIGNGSADFLICQEGIEHFADQLRALREFNRIIRPGGALIITTPNYSNLRSRLSYLLMETERFNSLMPPNEIDSIWMSQQDITGEIYFGHIFLIGIQKLRLLAKLAGFKIRHIEFTRIKPTSLLLLPFLYPFIFLSSWFTYMKNRKGRNESERAIYREIFNLAINPKIMIDGHLFVEFEKVHECKDVAATLKSRDSGFNQT